MLEYVVLSKSSNEAGYSAAALSLWQVAQPTMGASMLTPTDEADMGGVGVDVERARGIFLVGPLEGKRPCLRPMTGW